MSGPGEARATSTVVRIDAPAKINLLLRVLHRRPDGYRELETLFQAISLRDTVEVSLDRGGTSAGTTLEVRGADVGPMEQNLAFRAAAAFREAAGLSGAIHIDLVKRIPAGAGLGGGSSDAAAVLRALRDLVGEVDAGTLHRVGSELGSDVPFFLCGSPLALGRGRGEVLTPLEPLPEAGLVLALPPVHIATAGAYGALSVARGGEAGEQKATGRRPRTDAALRPSDWGEVASLAENDFEEVVVATHAEIAHCLEGLRAEGASFAMLSGSGGASFGVFDSHAAAAAAASRLEARLGWPFLPARTLASVPGTSRLG